MSKFDAPRDESDQDEQDRQRMEMLLWFASHQHIFFGGKLPTTTELPDVVQKMQQLNSLCDASVCTQDFQVIQARCGQLSAASKLLTALCEFAGSQEGNTAYDTYFAGQTTSVADLKRYANILLGLQPIDPMEMPTSFLEWYAAHKNDTQ